MQKKLWSKIAPNILLDTNAFLLRKRLTNCFREFRQSSAFKSPKTKISRFFNFAWNFKNLEI